MTRTTADERQADVIVVGAGPAGASAAYHLAKPGSTCSCWRSPRSPATRSAATGSPRARSSQLIGLGFDLDAPGWQKNRACDRRRRPPARAALADLASSRRTALVRTRHGPRRDPRPARPEGGRAAAWSARRSPAPSSTRHRPRGRRHRQAGRRPGPQDRRRGTYRAPVVVAATASPPGWTRAGPRAPREPADGVAVRAYYGPRATTTPWMESWLELWDGKPARATCCPATAGSSASATAPPTSASDPEHLVGVPACRLQGAAGPLARRTRPTSGGSARRTSGPSARRRCRWASTASRTTPGGVLLVGDAGGMVNPFNGEGIDYALEAGDWRRTRSLQALAARRVRPRAGAAGLRRRARRGVRRLLHAGTGFAKMIGNPTFMKQATRHGLPRTR